MIKDGDQCSKQVPYGAGYHYRNCKKRPVVEVDGKKLCSVQRPAGKKKRDDKSNKKYNETMDRHLRAHTLLAMAQDIPTLELKKYKLVKI